MSRDLLIDVVQRLSSMEGQSSLILQSMERHEAQTAEINSRIMTVDRKLNTVASTVERMEPIVLNLENVRIRRALIKDLIKGWHAATVAIASGVAAIVYQWDSFKAWVPWFHK